MTSDLTAARINMVESQVRTSDVTDYEVQDAMRQVAREDFCGGKTHLAYADVEVEYAPGAFLLKPRDLAKLLQALNPGPGRRRWPSPPLRRCAAAANWLFGGRISWRRAIIRELRLGHL